MRTVLVLVLLTGGAAFSYPYWQSKVPQLGQFFDGLLNRPAQVSTDQVARNEFIPIETPAEPKAKMVYRWTDDNGQMKFTEHPPSDGREFKEMTLKSQQPTARSQQEKEQRVAGYKNAAKSYRQSSNYTEKPPRSRSSSSSSKSKCRSIKNKIKKKEQQLSSNSYKGPRYDKKNSELRDLKYQSLKDC